MWLAAVEFDAGFRTTNDQQRKNTIEWGSLLEPFSLKLAFGANLGATGPPFQGYLPTKKENDWKTTSKWRLRGTLEAALASFWIQFACPDVTWQCLYSFFVDSWVTYCSKLRFCNIDAYLEQKLRFASPGAQDGATWAKSLTKSRWELRKIALEGQVEIKFEGSVSGAPSKWWGRPETTAPKPRLKSSQRSGSI